MTRADLTEKILDIKREKGWSWKYLHEQIGGTSPVLLVGALLGQMKLTKPQAAKAADLFCRRRRRRCSTRCRCAAPACRCRPPIR
jgi:cyanate lyase